MPVSKWAISAGILALVTDQVTKYLVIIYAHPVLNTGGIFGLGQNQWWWPVLVCGILIGCGIFLKKIPHKNPWYQTASLTIVASGLSNFADRVTRGGVIDWIFYPILNVVGNLADVYLGLGVIIILLLEFQLIHYPHKL